MRFSALLFTLFRFFLPPAIISTIYIYYYPLFQACAFPLAKRGEAACYRDGTPAVRGEVAPFRLLAFGDPQLEGDTSLPDPDAAALPHLEDVWRGLGRVDLGALWTAVRELLVQDVPTWLQAYRKRLDLWGNDRYLAHIAHTMSWWTQPTHTVVLGDLLGSQWIDDEEFDRRTARFWKTVFKYSKHVPRGVTDVSARTEVLGRDERWKNRLIAVAGNHDIGYAGDLDEHRIERFEQSFGSVNWVVRFRLNKTTPAPPNPFESSLAATPPELRLVILNSMNLDGPAYKPHLRDQSLQFLHDHLTNPVQRMSSNAATILLTHIPLHKPEAICVDRPYCDYYPPNEGGGIREQNHLSQEMSTQILNGLADNGGKAIILNGHDHWGCNSFHHRSASDKSSDSPWSAVAYSRSKDKRIAEDGAGIREITVRSMMGSFSGNVGLLSAWYDRDAEEWKFDYASCMLGVQHFWWGVHVLDWIVLGLGLGGVVARVIEEVLLSYGGAAVT